MHSGDMERLLLARAVENAVFESLLLAERDPDNANKWFRQADLLEQKFKTQHGVHYTAVLYPELKVTFT